MFISPCLPHRARFLALAVAFVLSPVSSVYAAAVPGFQYVSPDPDSPLNRVTTNIILRPGQPIDPATVSADFIAVAGSASGAHPGELALSDDGLTLIFMPSAPFALGETVSVSLLAGLKTLGGDDLPALSYSFLTSPENVALNAERAARLREEWPAPAGATAPPEQEPSPFTTLGICDLPSRYPTASVISSNDPEPGDLFLSPFLMASEPTPGGHLLIVDNRGNPIFWRSLSNHRPNDFRLAPNGQLSFIGSTDVFLMDSSYTVVDSVTTGNGYPIDGHEFQMLPNGHLLLMSVDPQPIRMDTVVAGGLPDAVVLGLVLQELDLQRHVVFQWRSWDHFLITDCVSPAVDLLGTDIDYVHGNSIELDTDGNWLVSSRHLNEITKINRTTGEILWRMGPHAVHNDFTFLNDPRGFSHQHDVRRLANGHIIVFDNGNYLNPQYSRAIEYDVDEVAKTVQLVWQYRSTPDTFSGFMGSVQRRADGATIVAWGGNQATTLRVSDLHPDGSLALALGLKARTFTYRAYRSPWQTTLLVPDSSALEFGSAVPTGSAKRSRHTWVRNHAHQSITINCAAITSPAFALVTPLPITLAPGDSADIDVEFDPLNPGIYHDRLYLRSLGEYELIAGVVDLDVSVNAGVAVGDGRTPLEFGLHEGRPNPFRASVSFRFDLPRPSFVTLEVFDVRGRKVDTVVSGMRMGGRHEVSWSPVRVPDGVYFCRFRAGDYVSTRKLVRFN